MLGQGRPIQEILGGMREVVEGVRTAPAAASLARRHDVEMPITEAVTRLLRGETEPQRALHELMTRELKVETAL
jgi:glycerol-3-phosphate dehydrogenase (NAD(P)+)